ncbi:MAG: nucleotidyltransferase [Anaerolineales bacterium]|nr:nucleotidyltransferase [Anaerolineales bacterium]
MISVQDAFKKFRSRLELTKGEQEDASRRQQEVRAVMDEAFDIDSDYLTGSYARWTKTKPLKDVDIFCVLGEDEEHYRSKDPSVLLGAVEDVLVKKYGRKKVSRQRRSVTVRFGVVEVNGETNEQVMSFDVVPAFAKGDHYEIPDTAQASGWTETNPQVHADLAVKAHAAYSQEWKGIVRMARAWNRQNDKPIKPSFLIEVMALDLLHPPFGGDYRYEMKGFFASLCDRIGEQWPDPAKLGPAVSDSMDSERIRVAQERLQEAQSQAAQAIQLEKQGKQGDALRKWRELFGPLFPLS